MKVKYCIALVLVLVGTNLFTFASTRYWTTKHVLIQAHVGKIGGSYRVGLDSYGLIIS